MMGDSKTYGIVVAVDGPAASGKSTVSKLVAQHLGFVYCDSGALYRAVTWKALRTQLAGESEQLIMDMLAQTDWQFECRDNRMEFTIDGIDPGNEIRSALVADHVSHIASMPEVRAFIVEKLRAMATFGDIVMEGRDIGSVVFPDADYKYYIDASAEERARRRHREFVQQNDGDDVEKVLESLKRRDLTDSTRKTAPLQISSSAVVIDSTNLNQQQVAELIIGEVLSQVNEKS